MVLSTTIESEMKKRQYKPQTKILNLRDDLGLDEDINIEVWRDPSRQACMELLLIFGQQNSDAVKELSEEDAAKMNDTYFHYASMILTDCDIKGISFSTPEETQKAFDDERLPWGIFHMALMVYLSRLTDDYQVLKNALRRVRELSNSGNENSENEEE
jgi:hypothetical protein